MLLSTTQLRHPSITSLLRLLRPTASKLRSIPLPWVTTPLRHLNVTSQPPLLQFTAGSLLKTTAKIYDVFNCVQICRSHLNSYLSLGIVELKWENTFFNGNHLLRFLFTPSILFTFGLVHMLESLLLLKSLCITIYERYVLFNVYSKFLKLIALFLLKLA
jgi:hypothetical protein